MKTATSFEFSSRSFDEITRTATFTFTVRFQDEKALHFTESLAFPVDKEMSTLPAPLMQRLLEDMHLILGVSYWKLYIPRTMNLVEMHLSQAQADFWTEIYTIGMGEFHYRNGLDYRNAVIFPVTEYHQVDYFELQMPERALVGLGGGKDSIVSGELMKERGYAFDGFTLENAQQRSTVDTIAQHMGVDLVRVVRTLDPQLRTLSDGYNGHVPVSAIYAFAGVFTAALYGYKYVIVSNEASANEGNVMYHGRIINHQWSKSIEFETMFQEYVHRYVIRGITYFSLLRPFTEMKIVELFLNYPQYLYSFSSCNRNFRITEDGSRQPMHWCGQCAKCAFAFAMLAAYLPQETVVAIFDKNLFADPGLTRIYEELLGIRDIKPFDCVGTPSEVQAAVFMAIERGWPENDPIVQLFNNKVLQGNFDASATKQAAIVHGDSRRIPQDLLSVIADK